MATSFEKPIDRFFYRIEEDREFFQYFNLDDDQAMQLARRRASHYLMDAIDRMMLDGMPDVNFTDYDETVAEFNIYLTTREIFILASLMYEYYLEKDIAKIKTYSVNYTHADLKVFDPSNARTSFMEIYNGVKMQNEKLLDSYRNTDRLTGAFKGIDFAAYSEEEGA